MSTARSIGILTAINALGGLVAVAASVVMAYFFGATRALEVFFAAATLQQIVTRLTQAGQLGEIFLPIYHGLARQHSREHAMRAFSVLLNWMVLLSAVVCTALWFAAPYLVRVQVPGFSASDHEVGVVMFRCLLPLLGAQALASLCQTLAHAESRFGWPEAAGVGARVLSLATILSLARVWGVWAMVAAMWVSQVARLIGCLAVLYGMGYRHRLSLRQADFSAWAVYRKVAVTLTYVGATQVYILAMDAGLSLLPQGTYAVFKYVQQLYQKNQGLMLRPVTVVFFTAVSRAVAQGASTVRALARSALRGSLAISAVVIVAVVASARSLLAALWGSSQFGPDHLALAACLLVLFHALLPVAALAGILRKTVMSLGMVKSQYVATSMTQLACAAAAWWLIGAFGVWGAILAIAINVASAAIVPGAVLWLRRRELLAGYELMGLLRWLGAIGLAVGAALGAGLLLGEPPAAPGGLDRLVLLLTAMAQAALAVTVCLTAAWWLRIHEVREMLRRIGRLVTRNRRQAPSAD